MLVAMARNDGMAIVSLDELQCGPVYELFESNLVQIFRIGQINESTAELCLTVPGWRVAQKLRYQPDDDGDSASVEVLSASDSVVQAANTVEFLECGGQIPPSASSPTDDEL
jgi:hypothetical protein